VALLVAFLVRESTAREPLIPLRIFRSRNVSGANAIQALFVAGMFGMFFMGALYMQRVLGYDALQTGLAFLPSTLVMGTLSLRYAERLVMRFGARSTLLPGLGFGVAGLVLLTRAPVDGSYAEHVLPVMILLGAGGGLSFPALMTLSMSGATPSDAGLASGLVNTTLQVGGALGLAVLATLSSTRTEDLLAGGDPTAAALNGGYHLAYLIGAGLILAALGIALTVLQPEPKAAGAVEAPKPKPAPRRRPEPACEPA
jgi:predicted MFS family arabinose efflux permease